MATAPSNFQNENSHRQADNNDNMNKENQNTENIPMQIAAIDASKAYHGEYYKALTDALFGFLDSAFKKHLECPYASWLKYFEKSMEKDVNKILHFYPILLHELKNKMQSHYLSEFERINADKHLSFLQNKLALTFYRNFEDENDEKSSSNDMSESIANNEIICYSNPKQTIRDQQLMKINDAFRREIECMDQKIAMAQYKKNELLAKIEQKKKTLFTE